MTVKNTSLASLGFIFSPDEVSIICPACGTRLMGLSKPHLTITEAIDFLSSVETNMLCKACSEPPEIPPKPEELH